MTLIAWFLIAHLIGDWMLQNDWMARKKRGRWWSRECLTHCAVYTLVLSMALWFLGPTVGVTPAPNVLVAFAIYIFMTHLTIDGLNLPRHWGRLVGQSDNPAVAVVVDQTMHLIVLAVAALLLT